MSRVFIAASLSFFLLAIHESDAFAHARLKVNGLIKPRSAADGLKTGPCGNVARTNTPTVLAPGQTVDIEWEETIDHPGSFKFSFSPANDLGFETNLLKEVTDTQNTAPLPHAYKTSITLPNVSCDTCALQLIQVMTDRTPPTFYYSCADIRLVAADFAPPADVSNPTAIPGDGRVVLSWTNPTVDFSQVLIVQSNAPITAIPVSGTNYTVGSTLGNGTVAFTGSSNTATILNLSNDQLYYFKLFAQSPRVFYSAGVEVSAQPTSINVAPNVLLQVRQAGQLVSKIDTSTGTATITAAVIDSNPNDTHQFDWSGSTAALIDLDTAPQTLSFDPSRLTPGVYTAVVRVTDSGQPPASTTTEIPVSVSTSTAVPANGASSGKTASSYGGGAFDFSVLVIVVGAAVANRRQRSRLMADVTRWFSF